MASSTWLLLTSTAAITLVWIPWMGLSTHDYVNAHNLVLQSSQSSFFCLLLAHAFFYVNYSITHGHQGYSLPLISSFLSQLA